MKRAARAFVLCLLLVAMVSHVAIADWSIAPIGGAGGRRPRWDVWRACIGGMTDGTFLAVAGSG